MKLVILGNGPAGVSAVKAIRAHNKTSDRNDVEIIMVSKEETPAYSPMFLPEYATGKLEEHQLHLNDSGFYKRFKIKTFFGETVDRIDDKNFKIILKSGEEIFFDRLLIATGATAIKPPIDGIDGQHVFFLSKLDDAKRLADKIPSSKKVLVVGAGAIGIEIATALNENGLNVTIIEMMDQIAPTILGKEGAKLVEASLRSKGIKLNLGTRVSKIHCNDSTGDCIMGDGMTFESDIIIICVGVKPILDFVKDTKLKIQKGIVVNEKMETNVPGIYAAGDVAESRNLYGEHSLNFTWYSAVEQGWIAGCNMIGEERLLTHSVRLNVIKGLDITCTNISQIPPNSEEFEVLTNENARQGIFEKIVLKNGLLVQYQGVNVSDDKIGIMYQAIKTGRNIEKFKNQIFMDSFSAAYTL